MFKKIIKGFMTVTLVFSSMFVAVACSCNKDNDDKDVTTMTRSAKVKELGDNVDKVPSATELVELEQPTTASLFSRGVKNQVSLLSDSIDEEVSVKPQYFEESSGYNYAIGSELERYNSNVEGAKSFKNELLTITTIKQYNIWVDRDHYSMGATSKVKVNYDVNLDMLTMEEIYIAPNGNKMGTVYKKIVSSYDVNGNIVIDSFRSEYHDDDLVYENSFHYNENVIFSFAEVNYQYRDSEYKNGVQVIDSVIGTYKLAEFVLEEGKEQTSLMTYSATTGKVNGVDQTFIGNGSLIALKPINGYNVIYRKTLSSTDKTYETTIYDVNGHTVADFYYNYTQDDKIKIKPMVAMYLLDGYQGVYKEESGNYYLLVDGNKYSTENLKYEDLTIYLSSHIEGLYIEYSKEGTITEWVEIPVIRFMAGKQYDMDSNFNVYDYLVGYFNTLGLSFKDNSLELIIENVQNSHDLIDTNWSAFGLSSFENVSYDVFSEMFNEYKSMKVDMNTINALNQEPSVMINEQVVDETEYKNIAINDEIEIAIDSSTGTIDLSKINIIIPKKQLFAEGNKYRLVVELTSSTHSIELTYQEVTFNNDSMNFTGFTSATPIFDKFKEGEQYTLSIYLAGYTSEGYLRMTNDIRLKYTNFSDFEIDAEKEDNTVVLSFKYTDKLIVELFSEWINR